MSLKQKDALKRYERYLPTLILKKQQLQMVIRQVESQKEKEREKEAIYNGFLTWVAVFGEPVDLSSLMAIKSFQTERAILQEWKYLFSRTEIEDSVYDLFTYPLWVDSAIEILKKLAALDAEIEVIKKQEDLLGKELTVTTQRVNLFEKVKIPETKESIRIIRIYLGDQQTAAVVRGKIAKNNIVKAAGL